MIIFLIVLSVLAYIGVFLVFFWRKGKNRLKTVVEPTSYTDGYLCYGEDSGLSVPIDVYIDREPHKTYYKRLVDKTTKVIDYGKFSLEIGYVKKEDCVVLDIYHTHIVPQVVRCRLEGGGITKIDGGYKYTPLTRHKKSRYVYLFFVRDVIVSEDELVFSVYDRARIICSCEEGGYKKIGMREVKALPPCTIHTPDKRLNDYLNHWSWAQILKVDNSHDFDLAVVLCAVKLCYTREGVGEFLKFHIISDDIDIDKKCLLVCLLCEYMEVDGGRILSDKIGAFTLYDYTVKLLSNVTLKINDEDDITVKLFLTALSRFINYVEAGEAKLKMYAVIENIAKKRDVKYEKWMNSACLYEYFSKDSRLEVKAVVKLAGRVIKGCVSECDFKEANPLWLTKPTIPISAIGAGLLWRVVMHDVVGMKKVGENLSFSPNFPKNWREVDLECSTGTGMRKVEFISAKSDVIKVDGVTFTGGVIPRGFGNGGKIEVYFSK